jgi:hypothetical protein
MEKVGTGWHTGIKLNYYHLLFFVLAFVLTTVARISLLLLAPLIILILIEQLGFAIRQSFIVLLFLILISYLLSLFNGFYIKYNSLSFFYILPFLLFLFSKARKSASVKELLPSFIGILTFFAIINDIIGIVQYIKFRSDDYFSGLYGHFTVTQNGLSILNSILFFYYLRRYQLFKHRKDLIYCFIFFLSAIMGFYGAGMVVLLAAFVLYSVRFNISKIIKGTFVTALVLGFIYYMTGLISPDTLTYNKNIIQRFIGDNSRPVPRKLTSYTNYVKAYTSDFKDLIFGSGPGTFNSRSAFVVGSPEYFSMGSFLKSDSKPYYFENYAYTLWNAGNTGQYQDGFMNQPFSSMLSFLGEYGLLFTIVFISLYYMQYKTVMRYRNFNKSDLLFKDLYKFCSIYLILLLVIDNYAEYPEITILIVLLLKLAEKELVKASAVNSIRNAE